jgi:peptide/nickel transport system substrate-binding protein
MQRAAALGIGTAGVASLISVLPDETSAQSAPAGSVTWALDADPVTLVPYGSASTSNMWGKEFMYDSLLEWDKDLAIQPALAESYEVSPDATAYTFKLRPGVTFHNGKTMTAADVKYSLDITRNPPEPVVPAAFLANIAEVTVVDDLTVTVTMAKPDPTLPGVLAWGRFSPIIPEGIADELNLLSEGIGTGPFKLVEYVTNDHLDYEANPNYWKPGVPCIQNLSLKILLDESSRVSSLRGGEIDGGTFSADVADTMEGDDELEVLSGLFSAPRVIHFNLSAQKPWSDVRVRQAINKAVDRQQIIENVYGGHAELTGPIPPGYGDWALPPDELAQIYAVDIEGAKALMAEAGFADGFDVTIIAISAPREYVQIPEIIRENLKELNINVKIEPQEIGTFVESLTSSSFEWASTGRGMRGDPSGFVIDFRSGLGSFEAFFGAGWKSEELDAAYDEALATSDVARRHELYTRIQEIISRDEVANLYTVQPLKFQVVRKRLTGMYVAFTDFNTGLRTACAAE